MAKIAILRAGRIGRTALKACPGWVYGPCGDIDIPRRRSLALFEVDSNHGRLAEPVLSEPRPQPSAAARSPTTTPRKPRRIGARWAWTWPGGRLHRPCGDPARRPGAHRARPGPGGLLVSAPSRTLDDYDDAVLAGIDLDSSIPRGTASSAWPAATPVISSAFGIETGFFSTVHAYDHFLLIARPDQPMRIAARLVGGDGRSRPAPAPRAALQFIWAATPTSHRQGLPRPGADRQYRRGEPDRQPAEPPPSGGDPQRCSAEPPAEGRHGRAGGGGWPSSARIVATATRRSSTCRWW